MNKSDLPQFAKLWAAAWDAVGARVTADGIELAFAALQDLELPDISKALTAHMRDPDRGRFAPKVADVMAVMGKVKPNGHPGPDEAWGIVAMMLGDERETVVLTEEIREAWALAQPVYALGDEVGARMTFRQAYERITAAASMAGKRPKWSVSLGTDPDLRITAMNEAVRLGRLSRDAAQTYLPGTSASFGGMLDGMQEQVKQLTGPTRDEAEKTMGRLRSLKQLIETREEEDRKAAIAERERKRAEFEEKRAAMLREVDARLKDEQSKSA